MVAQVRDEGKHPGIVALHHTYLRPAVTQQAAADLLDLPMSTFRRHLAEGIARLTDLLWQRAGPVPGDS